MNYFRKTLRWAVIVYFAGWLAKYGLGLAPYWLITKAHFLIPPVSAFVFLSICLSPLGKAMPRRKVWVGYAVFVLLLNSYLSWDAWRFYLIQNDAPMGLIPDLNALICLIADFLLMGLVFGLASLQEKSRGKGKENDG